MEILRFAMMDILFSKFYLLPHYAVRLLLKNIYRGDGMSR
jgi:hypothetical protein